MTYMMLTITLAVPTTRSAPPIAAATSAEVKPKTSTIP
jgi:hypothetical protein